MTTKPATTTSTPPSAGGQVRQPEAEQAGQSGPKQRPTRSIKVGSVQVAIWRNLTPEGRVLFNATLERLYFDEKAEQWESSHSFGRRDMLELAKAADIAHTAMSELYEHENRRTPAVRNGQNSR